MNHVSHSNRLCALTLAVIMLLGMTSAAAEGDPIAVQVGKVAYSAAEVQHDLDLILQGYLLSGVTLTGEHRLLAAQQVVDSYVTRGLTLCRLMDLKLADPDENTVYQLREAAQQQYDAYWQTFRDMDGSKSMSDAQLTAYLNENGMTLDQFYADFLTTYRSELLLAYYDVDTTVTDEMVNQYYEDHYVSESRSRYEHDIPLFEEEIVYGELSSAYAPDGFRIIYQIVLPVPEDIQARLDALQADADEAAAQAAQAYTAVADLALNGQDVSEQREIYQTAMARYDELGVEYGQTWQSVPDALRDQTDEIYGRLECGEAFTSLIPASTADPVLLYHQESAYWPESLLAAANTLKAIGDVSQPVLCTDGLHILYYQDDMPSGAVKLEGENLAYVRSLAEGEVFQAALETLTAPWREQYGVTTNLSLLSY